MFQPSKRI
jgi:hypothetical protein